jgi:iron(III) transport system permease protein
MRRLSKPLNQIEKVSRMAVTTTARTKGRRITVSPRYLLIGITVAILGFSVIYPVILLLINSFIITQPWEPAEYGLEAWRFAIFDDSMGTAIWNSIRLALVHQAISLPIAIVISWLIARTNMPWGNHLEFFFWMAFFIPLIPSVQAWTLLLEPNYGLVNSLFDKIPLLGWIHFNLFSFWGMVWMHLVTSTIAIKVMLFTPAFRNLDASLEEASIVSGGSPIGTLRRVTVPVLTPTLITIMVLALIRAFQSVEIELVLGFPSGFFVFGSKIYDLTRYSPPDYGAATAMGIYVMAAMVPLIVFHRHMTSKRHYTTLTGAFKPQVQNLGRWKWPAFGGVLGMGLLMTIVPMVMLTLGTFMKLYGHFDVPSGWATLDNWRFILGDDSFRNGVKNTLILAFGGATLSVGVFSMMAYVLSRWRFPGRGVVDFLTWIPTALPGIVLALAWFWIVLRNPMFRPISGSIWILILVSGLGGITLGVQLMKASLTQLGTELEEASEVTGASWLTTMRLIVIPLLVPTMMVLWIFNFVSAAGQAIMPALLASPSSKPLALIQLEWVLAGESEVASVVGLFIVFMSVGVAILARAFGFRVGLGRTSM